MDEMIGRKAAIADAFKQLIIEADPKYRVNVVDIMNVVGGERKTFYYHFENIDHLIIWIVRSYLKEIVETDFVEYQMVRPDELVYDPCPDWPFYARIRVSKNKLDQGRYFKKVAQHWEDNREFYANLMINGQKHYFNLFNYLVQLFLPVFKDDIEIMLGDHTLPGEVVNFLAEYHVMGIFGRLQWHFTQTRKGIMKEEFNSFWNYGHACLYATIQSLVDPGKRHEPIPELFI